MWGGAVRIAIDLLIWALLAFWMWIWLCVLLQMFRVPLATAIAAAVSWIGVGLSMPLLLRHLASWAPAWLHLSQRFLTMR